MSSTRGRPSTGPTDRAIFGKGFFPRLQLRPNENRRGSSKCYRSSDEIQTDMAVAHVAAQHCRSDRRQFPFTEFVDEPRKVAVDVGKLGMRKENRCLTHGKRPINSSRRA